VVARHCELIFCVLTSPKRHLDEVEKATIQVVEWHLKVILCLLTIPNFDIGKVEKAMSERSPGTGNSFSCSCHRKMRIACDRKIDVSMAIVDLSTYFWGHGPA